MLVAQTVQERKIIVLCFAPRNSVIGNEQDFNLSYKNFSHRKKERRFERRRKMASDKLSRQDLVAI
jgi:hypothetical protein